MNSCINVTIRLDRKLVLWIVTVITIYVSSLGAVAI